MKTLRHLLNRHPCLAATPSALAALCLAGMSITSKAAVLVDADGVTVTFNAAPAASDFGTAIVVGDGLTFANAAQLDSFIIASVDGSIVTGTLPTSASNPPTQSALGFRYNTALQFIQSRPTTGDPPNTVAATLLKSTIQNVTGGEVTALTVSYDFSTANDVNEEINGFRVFYSLTGAPGSWINIPLLSVDTTAAIAAPENITATLDLSATPWANSSNAYLLWVDDNGDGVGDPSLHFDNLTLTPTISNPAINLVWNLAHTVGGAPNGSFELSAAQYWLDGVTATGFSTSAIANFTQDPAGTATINVPADITAAGMVVGNASGTYLIGGAGAISASLTKQNAGTLQLTSANNFSSVTLSGGLTITANPAAFGNAGIVAGGTATLQTDTDLTVGGLGGAGSLTKTGAGVVTFTAGGSSTGALVVQQGGVRLLTGGAAGTAAVSLDGTQLAFGHLTGDQTFNGGINVGAGGAIVSVENGPGSVGVIIGQANSITGSGDIIKTGPGALRVRSNQTAFTGNWIINSGAIEYGTGLASALGTGLVTINAGGELAGQNTIVPVANIVLNGGALGTRTGQATDFQGSINITADSELRARSLSTPTGAQPFTISGVLSGGGKLSVTGALPDVNGVIPTGNYPAPRDTERYAVALTNVANSNSGGITVTARQFISSEPAGGTGNTLGTGPLELIGGSIRVRDNGTGNDGIINYGQDVIISPAAAPNDVESLIDVNRQLTGGSTGNTISFGSLTISTGSTLGTIGGNGYAASFAGTADILGVGDVTFNPTTASLTLAGGLGAGGYGLIKTGAGVLTVANGGTYTGNTTVSGGTLRTNGQISGSPQIDVRAGATLDVSQVAGGLNVASGQTLTGAGTVNGNVNLLSGGAITAGDAGAGTLTIGSLSLSHTAGTNPRINIALNAVPSLLAVGTPNGLSTSGGAGSTRIFVSSSGGLAIGAYNLITYAGAIGGNGFAGFSIGGLPNRTVANLSHNTGVAVQLNVTGVDFPVWTGAFSTEWSTNVIGGAKNWVEDFSNNATDFLSGDRVLFDDTAASGSVEISNGDVTVNGLEFNNNTLDYSIAGTGGIAGNVPLVKAGGATVLIATTNTFTGNVQINGGTLRVPVVTDAGVAGPLGTGTTISINGGVLQFSGATGATNRLIITAGTGGTVNVENGSNLTLSGTISGASLVKAGSGTLVLTNNANTPASIVITGGALEISAAGNIGTGTVANDGDLVVTNTAQVALNNQVSGSGTLTKNGAGQLTIGGATANTYTGTTTVNAGELVMTNPSGINSIGGDLVVNAGGIVTYGTTAGQIADHIPDTAHITINGGTFGSGSANTQAAPTANITDTVGAVTVNSGTFLSGRNGAITPFTINGAFTLNGGTTLIQRGGGVSAQSVAVSSGAILNFDGGSTSAGQESKLLVGPGGISLDSATINMNAGPSAITAASQGSTLVLGGSLTSTGTTTFVRLNPAQLAPRAQIDLAGGVRNFDITGTLTLGTVTEPVSIVNGGLIKTGTGTLALAGNNTYAGVTDIQQGAISLTGTLSASTPILVSADATLDVSAIPGGFTLSAAQTLGGNGTVNGNTTINGTLAPGFTIGTITLTGDSAFTASGVAAFDISKSGISLSSDLAAVTGTLALGGTLIVTHSGDALAQGDTFNLLDAAGFTGDFALYSMPPLDPGLFWDTSDVPVDGTITVVPEPGSTLLLLGGLALLGFRRRRV